MTKVLRGALGAVVLVAAVAAFTGAATAETLELRPAGGITEAGRIGISFEGFEVSCNVTISGTFAGTISTREGAHMGSVEPIRYRECSGGALTERILEQTVEVHYYRTLANGGFVLGILYEHPFAFLIENGFFSCLYSGALNVLVEVEGGITRLATVLSGTGIGLARRLGGLLECPRTTFANGTLSLEPTQRPTII